jgi:hypothetical protein
MYLFTVVLRDPKLPPVCDLRLGLSGFVGTRSTVRCQLEKMVPDLVLPTLTHVLKENILQKKNKTLALVFLQE